MLDFTLISNTDKSIIRLQHLGDKLIWQELRETYQRMLEPHEVLALREALEPDRAHPEQLRPLAQPDDLGSIVDVVRALRSRHPIAERCCHCFKQLHEHHGEAQTCYVESLAPRYQPLVEEATRSPAVCPVCGETACVCKAEALAQATRRELRVLHRNGEGEHE